MIIPTPTKSFYSLMAVRSVLEEHHVYSLQNQYLCAPAERYVLEGVQVTFRS
jgi:hypothetical protein